METNNSIRVKKDKTVSWIIKLLLKQPEENA